MYVCMYVYVYVCMYVCMYVCIYVGEHRQQRCPRYPTSSIRVCYAKCLQTSWHLVESASRSSSRSCMLSSYVLFYLQYTRVYLAALLCFIYSTVETIVWVCLLSICKCRTKTAWASGVFAPKVWHNLPDSIRSCDSITSFNKNLKTYLYHQAFTSWLATYSLPRVIEFMLCS